MLVSRCILTQCSLIVHRSSGLRGQFVFRVYTAHGRPWLCHREGDSTAHCAGQELGSCRDSSGVSTAAHSPDKPLSLCLDLGVLCLRCCCGTTSQNQGMSCSWVKGVLLTASWAEIRSCIMAFLALTPSSCKKSTLLVESEEADLGQKTAPELLRRPNILELLFTKVLQAYINVCSLTEPKTRISLLLWFYSHSCIYSTFSNSK